MWLRPRASSAARTLSPVPTGTVLFMTRIERRSSCGSSSITVQTRERSASPEYVGGVSTQTNTSSAASAASAASSVKVSRSRFRSSRSPRPGSKKGTSPFCSRSTFSGTTSRTVTSWPSSAKQAAVTRPTQPAPKTVSGSLPCAFTRSTLDTALELRRNRAFKPGEADAAAKPRRPLWSASQASALKRPKSARDRDHRLVRERVVERVDDPVRRAVLLQHDHVEVRSRVEELERPVAEVPDEVLLRERGSTIPLDLLDPPVLAGDPIREDQPYRLVSLQRVDARVRRLRIDAGAPVDHGGVLDAEGQLSAHGAHERQRDAWIAHRVRWPVLRRRRTRRRGARERADVRLADDHAECCAVRVRDEPRCHRPGLRAAEQLRDLLGRGLAVLVVRVVVDPRD